VPQHRNAASRAAAEGAKSETLCAEAQRKKQTETTDDGVDPDHLIAAERSACRVTRIEPRHCPRPGSGRSPSCHRSAACQARAPPARIGRLLRKIQCQFGRMGEPRGAPGPHPTSRTIRAQPPDDPPGRRCRRLIALAARARRGNSVELGGDPMIATITEDEKGAPGPLNEGAATSAACVRPPARTPATNDREEATPPHARRRAAADPGRPGLPAVRRNPPAKRDRYALTQPRQVGLREVEGPLFDGQAPPPPPPQRDVHDSSRRGRS